MLAENSFTAERLDLQHYKGFPITDFQVEIEGVYLPDYAEISFVIFAKPHGKIISIVPLDVPDSGNVLKININADTMDLRPSLYFYEVRADVDASPSDTALLKYGVIEII